MDHEVHVRTSRGIRRFLIGDAFVASLSETEKRNKETVTLLVAGLLTLLADSPLGPDKPPSLYSKFLRDLQREGVKATVIRFTNLAHTLVSQMRGHQAPSIGAWIEGFRDTPVFKEYHHFYRTGNVKVVRWLYTFLSFGKKMEYVDPEFNSTAFRGWLDNEVRLGDLVLPQEITDSLREILRVVLPPFVIQDFRPRFGPGSVSERGIRQRLSKIENLRYDAVLDRFFFHGHLGKYGYGSESGLTAEKVLPLPELWDPARGISSRQSLLTFVPKNVKTARSICMEPNTLMFFQQGVMDQMVDYIGSSEFGKFIRLQDQSFNRRLSQLGSKTGKIDTLDLSSASDCLSYDLVKAVFPPSWQIAMRATRSTSVLLPDGTVRSLKKFAPMGSALCFPTQCIIYCAVCILAACQDSYNRSNPSIPFATWLNPRNIRWCMRQFWQHVSTTSIGYQPLGVYGDDICVDSQLTDVVKSILTSLGFIVNVDKSFTGSQLFRESCGGFYLKGHDISPLYFSVKGVQEITTPEHVASQVHLINRCWERGYKTTYRFFKQSILTWDSAYRRRKPSGTLNPIPYVSDPNVFGIRCSKPSNTHLKGRYNSDYQRDEIRVWTIVHTVSCPAGDLLGAVDKYEYVRWWASRRQRVASPEETSSVLRYDTGSPGLRWRWIPEQ